MTYKYLSVFILFISISTFAQKFEGVVTYSNTYKTKTPTVTDEQLTEMMGDKHEYSTKNGNYKTESNGTLLLWQLYINKDNKLYTKLSTSDTATWTDAGINNDIVISSVINKDVTEVMGYRCNELVLTCKSGIQKYYFNSSTMMMSAQNYLNHKFGNWLDYLMISNALPLKYIIENNQFILESTAVQIFPQKLDEEIFLLPAGVKTEKK